MGKKDGTTTEMTSRTTTRHGQVTVMTTYDKSGKVIARETTHTTHRR